MNGCHPKLLKRSAPQCLSVEIMPSLADKEPLRRELIPVQRGRQSIWRDEPAAAFRLHPSALRLQDRRASGSLHHNSSINLLLKISRARTSHVLIVFLGICMISLISCAVKSSTYLSVNA